MNKIAVFDIDMTIIDSKWVWEHLDECKSFSAVYDTYGDKDIPILSTINIIKQLHENGVQPVFLTAIPLSDFDRTITSLRKHLPFLSDISLYMVGYDEGIDLRKCEILQELQEDNDILFFMDDCPYNRLIATDLGIVSLDVIK